MDLIKELPEIREKADARVLENEAFSYFLSSFDNKELDEMVHRINDAVSKSIDCTQCGNCCKSLMINVTPAEVTELAINLEMEPALVKTTYIEESLGGKMIMNTIPCNFLTGTTCSIYPHRFTECRDFPHLHKANFFARLNGLLMYYGMCPIIFNVVEQLKTSTQFLPSAK